VITIDKYMPTWMRQAIRDGKKPFFVHIPAKLQQDSEGHIKIEGLGSKFERSRTGHRLSQSLITKLKETSPGKISLWHHDPNQIVGKVIGVEQSADDEIKPIIQVREKTGNQIVDKPMVEIESCLKEDIPLGMSIGGITEKFELSKAPETTQGFTIEVEDAELVEWTVTPLNAVKSSDGSIAVSEAVCKDGVCGQIAQQILSGPNLPEADGLVEGIKLSPKSFNALQKLQKLKQDFDNVEFASTENVGADVDDATIGSALQDFQSAYDALIDAIISDEASDEDNNEESDEAIACQCGATNTPDATTCAVCGADLTTNSPDEAQAAYGNNQYSIADSMQNKMFTQAKKSDYTVNQTCYDNAVKQIKAGEINNGTWKKPTFADFDSDIDEYKKYALAVHPDGDATLSGSYGFEIGKNGKIYRQGVIAAKTAAAGGRSKAGKNDAIYQAADKLLQLIDADDEEVNQSIKLGGGNIKKLDKNKNNKLEQSTGVALNQPCYDFATQAIEDGDIDFTTPWNRGSYEWNGELPDLTNYCLGIDPTGQSTFDQYMYRIGMNGLIFKSAVLAVAANAPAGSDIYEAADELLQAIYEAENAAEESDETDEGETDESGVSQSIKGGDIMGENKELTDLKQMVSTLAKANEDQQKLIQSFVDEREEAKKAAELKLAEDARKEEIATIVKQSQEETLAAVTDVFVDFAKQTMQNKDNLQQMSVTPVENPNAQAFKAGGGDPFQVANEIKQNMDGGINTPQNNPKEPIVLTGRPGEAIPLHQALTDSVNYPAVVNGKAVQGVTPNQMFGVN
jgi:ribosomal protein L40E